MYYECKVKYERTMENGMVKKVTEPYLVEAITFSEAESIVIKEVTPYINGEFAVTAVGQKRISEIFTDSSDSADKWYRAKLVMTTLDEKTCKEKKHNYFMLIQSSGLREAIKRLDEGMKGTMMDYSIASIAETQLMDVFQYNNQSNN